MAAERVAIGHQTRVRVVCGLQTQDGPVLEDGVWLLSDSGSRGLFPECDSVHRGPWSVFSPLSPDSPFRGSWRERAGREEGGRVLGRGLVFGEGGCQVEGGLVQGEGGVGRGTQSRFVKRVREGQEGRNHL